MATEAARNYSPCPRRVPLYCSCRDDRAAFSPANRGGPSGPGGIEDIIRQPTDREIVDGDMLIFDTGSTYDGYFSDFDRNFAFTSATQAAKDAYRAVWEATEAGVAAARPGATTTDVFTAMNEVLKQAGSLGNDVGRMGHGLGMCTRRPPGRSR